MSDEQESIKKEIAKLVQEYAEIVNAERLESKEPVYVVGWALSAEYESTSMMQNDTTASLNIYPSNQPRSITRGLYEFGVDAYRV